ncbi:MAG: TM1802 family CRISPR-associated protein, partial [Spirochaetota bacterium]|nr:TM1802 family CRISPR-associated protein [Spirochaetota bacterium]
MIKAIYEIGKANSQNKEPIDSLIKNIEIESFKVNKKDGSKTPVHNYVLRVIFDLINNEILLTSSAASQRGYQGLIEFDPDKSFKTFLYCGNNGRREKQYYLTRLFDSSDYLFGNTIKMLHSKLQEQPYQELIDNELFKILNKLQGSSLYNNKINTKSIKKDKIFEELTKNPE